MSDVSSNFETGASYVISYDNYLQFLKNPEYDLAGRPDGQFVTPSNEMDQVLLVAIYNL